MIGHLLLATSPSPTKSSCNRQEEGKNPTSYSCIPINRANHEQTLRLHMYEPLRVQARLATGKGTISFLYLCFRLQEARHSSQKSEYGVVISAPPTGLTPDSNVSAVENCRGEKEDDSWRKGQ